MFVAPVGEVHCSHRMTLQQMLQCCFHLFWYVTVKFRALKWMSNLWEEEHSLEWTLL